MSDGRHRGRVALVTGAASGIGRATAERLAAEGASVVCLDVADAVSQTVGQIEGARGHAVSVVADISDASAVESAVNRAASWRDRLDIVVNCAGVGSIGRTESVTETEWDRVIAINLTGTFRVTQATLPHLIASRGNVVSIASIAGLGGWRYMAPYAASKAGIVALTKSWAVEFSDRGVRFNCVAPGSVDTPLARALQLPDDAEQRLVARSGALVDPPRAEPAEIAGAIAYLASDEARFVTGSILVIDGGATL